MSEILFVGDSTYDDINEFICDYFSDISLAKYSQYCKANRSLRHKNIVCAFDIETSNVGDNQSIMYLWQFQLDMDYTIMGRTWEEYRLFIDCIADNLSAGESILVYVHNLSYEIVFLTGIFDFNSTDLFFIKSRRCLKALYRKRIEYRCSYMLSNKPLYLFLKDMDVEHKKLSGEIFDYKAIRYPWTKLSPYQLNYGINDVLGLVEAIYKQLTLRGDNIESIPFTQTGYVRRECKRALRLCQWVKDIIPEYEVYRMLELAFRGGDVHANRYRSRVINTDVEMYDIASSYPFQMLCREFPITKFMKISPHDLEYYRKHNYAALLEVEFYDVTLKDIQEPTPYISYSKIYEYDKKDPDMILDNGRVLTARYFKAYLTDIDYDIIKRQYDIKIEKIKSCYVARYGRLPKELRDIIHKHFKDKTMLKNVPGKAYEYLIAKEIVNSIYGMMVEKSIKHPIVYDIVTGKCSVDKSVSDEELYNERKKKLWLPFQWGVWVTAHARNELHSAIQLVGHDHIYNDTDSIYTVGKHQEDFNKFNADILKLSKEYSAIDSKGKTRYLGIFEFDGRVDKFKTLGSKKYVKENNGELTITIAGVNKEKGAKELGSIDNFDSGFIFRKAGGVELKYNDKRYIGTIHREGHTAKITRNICIVDSTYKLNLTGEYENLLDTLSLPLLTESDMLELGELFGD